MSATEIRQHLHLYIDKADQRFLNMIYAMTKEYSNDIVALSAEEKRAIDKGLVSLKQGNFSPHDSVMTSMKKKYSNLKFK